MAVYCSKSKSSLPKAKHTHDNNGDWGLGRGGGEGRGGSGGSTGHGPPLQTFHLVYIKWSPFNLPKMFPINLDKSHVINKAKKTKSQKTTMLPVVSKGSAKVLD